MIRGGGGESANKEFWFNGVKEGGRGSLRKAKAGK
jgi:hypothetical protein